MNVKQHINYPYLPKGRTIEYIPADHPFMVMAKQFSRDHSIDKSMPTGSVIVKDGVVIGIGANGSDYHDNNECVRVRQGIPTGQGYELCEGCHPKNHSESRAIADAEKNNKATAGGDLYLWGHWWCCKPCWDSMIKAEIRNVYVMEDSEKLFNREHPDNIVGRQFS